MYRQRQPGKPICCRRRSRKPGGPRLWIASLMSPVGCTATMSANSQILSRISAQPRREQELGRNCRWDPVRQNAVRPVVWKPSDAIPWIFALVAKPSDAAGLAGCGRGTETAVDEGNRAMLEVMYYQWPFLEPVSVCWKWCSPKLIYGWRNTA